jgi:hypothetical protein
MLPKQEAKEEIQEEGDPLGSRKKNEEPIIPPEEN